MSSISADPGRLHAECSTSSGQWYMSNFEPRTGTISVTGISAITLESHFSPSTCGRRIPARRGSWVSLRHWLKRSPPSSISPNVDITGRHPGMGPEKGDSRDGQVPVHKPASANVTRSNGAKPPPVKPSASEPAKTPARQREARTNGEDSHSLKPVRSISGLTLADFLYDR